MLRFRLVENLDQSREVEGSVRPDIGQPQRQMRRIPPPVVSNSASPAAGPRCGTWAVRLASPNELSPSSERSCR